MKILEKIEKALAEYPETLFVCTECFDCYSVMPHGGYCDNSEECTGADLYDVANEMFVESWT